MGMDSRIGPSFLQAGLGFGGSCFPKDADSLVHTAAKLGYDFKILKAVVEVNKERAQRFVQMVSNALSPLHDKVIAVLGLAFKPNTDDMREARSVEVITELLKAGARVKAYDPAAAANAQRVLPPEVQYSQTPYEAAEGADGLAIVTEWNEFRFMNMDRVRQLMRRPIIFDGRNIYEPERIRRLGFTYYSIGRRPVIPG